VADHASPAEETEHDRLNRELDELLSELRVLLPGVQVLLAFLLTAPFSSKFDTVRGESRSIFVAAITLAALASILLIAPTVHHRLRFRDGTKEEMIRMANRLALAGATCLALAIGCAIYVVGDSAFSDSPARWIGPGIVFVAGITWYLVPLRYREDQTPTPS
jgi:succinate dehydrogenase hydrophobic anchor subunit